MAEQGVFVHAQRVIRQKMNILDASSSAAKLVMAVMDASSALKLWISGTRMVIFFPGRGKAFQVIQDPLGRTVRPLFEHVTVDVLQVGEEQIDVG